MIMNPTAIKHVVVDGHSLTLESFVAIARYNATVELAPSALEAMKKSRALAEKILELRDGEASKRQQEREKIRRQKRRRSRRQKARMLDDKAKHAAKKAIWIPTPFLPV